MTDDDRSARASGAANDAAQTTCDLTIVAIETVTPNTGQPYRLVTFSDAYRFDRIAVAISADIADDEILADARARLHDVAARVAEKTKPWALDYSLAAFLEPTDEA